MATISDVAKKAKVSVGTVSNVINNKKCISPKTRKRVVAAMQKFGYGPNIVARSLRSGKTHIVGLILPDITYPFFSELARVIENRFLEIGYSTLLCDSMEDLKKEKKYFQIMQGRCIDSVVFSGVKTDKKDNKHIAEFCLSGVPVLAVGRRLKGSRMASVTIDNFEASSKAAEYLIRLNHKNIAYINSFPHLAIGVERLKGFENALNKHKIKLKNKLVESFSKEDGLSYLEIGRVGVERLLKQGGLFTAIMCSNDLVAIGAMQKLRQQGINVPKDVSIIGFDDIPLSSLVDCPLTTIRQPVDRIGEEAVAMLMKLMEKRSVRKKHIVFRADLIIRNSCAPIYEGGL